MFCAYSNICMYHIYIYIYIYTSMNHTTSSIHLYTSIMKEMHSWWWMPWCHMVPGSASAIRLPATALPPGKSFPSCPRPTAIKINGKPLMLQRCRRWPLFWIYWIYWNLLDLFLRLHWADLGATSLMGHGRDVLIEAFEFRLLTRGIKTNKTGWLFECSHTVTTVEILVKLQ